ncbi:hypothetical protein OIE66_01880 [Nonomuraea sp. NBC_01738]|uniref:hypothetical protein n=1 Tax=Nonomuraea sp. NBC_01738 TaxID=2976003 RepID=UPI002E123859|nr:hypothetical protein OIE66_01880 [Nonomuraea sp. NBC_01738]
MRSLIIATLAVGAATAAVALPAQAAATKTLYGYAWADGQGQLRVTPVSATLVKKNGVLMHSLKAAPGAKEVRLGYGSADFRRLTVACDLKETEGRLALDAKGLGKTRCTPMDLAFTLRLQPNPVKIVYSGKKAVKINEFMPAKYYTKTAKGTIKRIDDDTIAFKSLALSYTWQLTFNRVTAKCQDGWLTGRPVNADDDGLGTKGCTFKDFTKAMKPIKYPTLAVVHYNPFSNQLLSVWEVYGDA